MNEWLKKRYEHRKKKILKKPFKNLFWLIVIMFFLPVMIWVLYVLGDYGYGFFMTSLSVGDALVFVSSILVFLGTIALGALVLWQNHNFKKKNDEKDKFLLHVENEKIRVQYLPQFLIQSADIENWHDKRGLLPVSLRHNHLLMNRSKSYAYSKGKWVADGMYPVVERGKEGAVWSIVNCGNNTAHQVKLSLTINGEKRDNEKATSIKKDDEIFVHIGIDPSISLGEGAVFSIRYFDSFQNVYLQEYKLIEKDNEVLLLSFTPVTLIKRSKSMDIQGFAKKQSNH